jgi:hypothetical protein
MQGCQNAATAWEYYHGTLLAYIASAPESQIGKFLLDFAEGLFYAWVSKGVINWPQGYYFTYLTGRCLLSEH